MEQIAILTITAYIVKAVVEAVSKLVAREIGWKSILAFVLGAACAVLFGVSVTSILGVSVVLAGPATLIVDTILLGVALMDGSGFLHDLLNRAKA